MPRITKAPDPAAGPKPPARAVCAELVKRYLKEGQTIYWARELPAFYRLWKLYPDLRFWCTYELPFEGKPIHGLNMMTWFEGEEGRADLARAWLLYSYVPAEPQVAVPQSAALDSPPSSQLDSPLASLPPRRARTVAEMLRG